MAKLLEQATAGVIEKPDCILLYGVEGVGKTTFASEYEKVLIIGTPNEQGSDNIDLQNGRKRIVAGSLKILQETLQELIDDKHDYKAVTLDTINKIDELVQAGILANYANCKGLGDVPNAKGWAEHVIEHLNIIRLLKELKEKRKINIIVLGHSEIKEFDEPGANKPYHRFQIAMREKISALYRQFCDDVIFVNYKTIIGEKKKDRPTSNDVRTAYTGRRAGWDAKNRSGLPYSFVFNFDNYKKAKEKGEPEAAPDLKIQITEMLEKIKDDKIIPIVKKNLSEAKDNTIKLIAIRDRLIEITAPAEIPA